MTLATTYPFVATVQSERRIVIPPNIAKLLKIKEGNSVECIIKEVHK